MSCCVGFGMGETTREKSLAWSPSDVLVSTDPQNLSAGAVGFCDSGQSELTDIPKRASGAPQPGQPLSARPSDLEQNCEKKRIRLK